jgi:hypothetical protein
MKKAINDELQRLFPEHVSRSPYQRLDREYRRCAAADRDRHARQGKRLSCARARHHAARRRSRRRCPVRREPYLRRSERPVSRLVDRLRQKEGLSYSAGSSLSIGSRQRLSSWNVAVMVAPQNAARAEQALLEEMRRARRDGFTAEEVAAARKGIVEARRRPLAGQCGRLALDVLSRSGPQLAVLRKTSKPG